MLFLLLGLVLAAGAYASSSEPDAPRLPSGDDDVARNAARELSVLAPVIVALQKRRSPITAEARERVQNLQAQIGAFPDGIIGPETAGRMRALGFPLEAL